MKVSIRPASDDDAEPLVELLNRDRAFLAPWQPARTEEFFTLAHQRREIDKALAQQHDGVLLPYVILSDGKVVGQIAVSNIVLRAFHSGDLGYWVSQAHNGRGVATSSVALMVAVAFEGLRLHRLQASTLPHNIGSQRVLARTGFERIGLAPKYLRIDGRWQDNVLFQRINGSFD